eukprot:COSAG04_NODE_20061_length_401_cov_1.701987_2_plen_78_part_01
MRGKFDLRIFALKFGRPQQCDDARAALLLLHAHAAAASLPLPAATSGRQPRLLKPLCRPTRCWGRVCLVAATPLPTPL